MPRNVVIQSASKIESTREASVEESSSSNSIGSLDSLDQVEYNVNQTDKSRATGNLGKSSEITWMQNLESDSVKRRNTGAGDFSFDDVGRDNSAKDLPHPHDLNYHLDDIDIGVSEPVQTYWVPPRRLADTLFNTYLHVAHPSLPIINRPLFSNQYRNFFDNSAIPGDKWLAILNMIFAIAASYAQKLGLEQHGYPQDHLLYLTRARILSMNGDDVLCHPDLQQAQVEGLISFYLLSTDQIHRYISRIDRVFELILTYDRSWRMSALAIRSAVSLGINSKNSGPTVTGASKEARNRLWWSLYIIESRLGIMTGRPTCISVNMCSSPFPLPLSDEQLQTPMGAILLNDSTFRDKRLSNIMVSSHLGRAPSSRRPDDEQNIAEAHQWLSNLPVNAELSFVYACDLTILTQWILDEIYTMKSTHNSRRHIQAQIQEIKSKVDLWLTSLPRSLDFTEVRDDDEARDEKTRLSCQYYSTRIILGRPFLCTHDKNWGGSDDEQRFAHAMAVDSARSAVRMAQMVPDASSDGQTLGMSPWWCCLHYVMQTATVLILELSLNCIHMAEQKSSLLHLTKKCIRWLNCTSKHSLASHRAWVYCNSSLRRISLKEGLSVDDLPSMSSWQIQAANTQGYMFPGEAHAGVAELNLTQDYSMYHPLSNLSGAISLSSFSADLEGRGILFPPDPLTESFFEYFTIGEND